MSCLIFDLWWNFCIYLKGLVAIFWWVSHENTLHVCKNKLLKAIVSCLIAILFYEYAIRKCSTQEDEKNLHIWTYIRPSEH